MEVKIKTQNTNKKGVYMYVKHVETKQIRDAHKPYFQNAKLGSPSREIYHFNTGKTCMTYWRGQDSNCNYNSYSCKLTNSYRTIEPELKQC